MDSYLTTARSGIDESSVQTLISQALTWKYLGTTTGTTVTTLPASYNELIIKASFSGGVNYTMSFAKEELKDTDELYFSGFNNGSVNAIRIQVSKTSAKIYSAELNGATVTNSVVLYYYYR